MLLHGPSENITKFLNGWKFDPLVIMPIFFIVFIFFVLSYDPQTLVAGVAMLVVFSPFWLPVFLTVIFIISWVDYIRFMFWFSRKTILLEIQLPQEVTKSPAAMETFLATLQNAGGETTFIARVWKGSYRPIWSLEIASNEGRLGFYMHIPLDFRSIVEARLYGQFPEAKIVEVDDYVARIPFNLDEYDIFGSEYQKNSPEAVPIRTYVDWKMDKDPKEEYKIDPLAQVLELLAQVGKGEYFWLQIILKARKNQSEWYGFINSKKDHFNEATQKEIGKLIEGAAKRAGQFVEDPVAKKQIAARGLTLLSEGEKRRVEAIERSKSKFLFECGIRTVYLAKKEYYHGINAGAIIRFFDTFRGQYGTQEYNSLGVTRGTVIFDYPWQDFMSIRKKILQKNLFFQYKNRAYFYVPYDQQGTILNTEEIATLWHFPSSGVQTPGLNRLPSRRAEAPINLPTGEL